MEKFFSVQCNSNETGETRPHGAPIGQQCHWGSWKVTTNDLEVCEPSSSSKSEWNQELHSPSICVDIRPRSPHQPLPYLLCSAQKLTDSSQDETRSELWCQTASLPLTSHPRFISPAFTCHMISGPFFLAPSAASMATPSRSR